MWLAECQSFSFLAVKFPNLFSDVMHRPEGCYPALKSLEINLRDVVPKVGAGGDVFIVHDSTF